MPKLAPKDVKDAGDKEAKNRGAGKRKGYRVHMEACMEDLATTFGKMHKVCKESGTCKSIDSQELAGRRLAAHLKKAAAMDSNSVDLLKKVKKEMGKASNKRGCRPTDIDDDELENKIRNKGKRVKRTKTKKTVGKFCMKGATKDKVVEGLPEFKGSIETAVEKAVGDAKKISGAKCDSDNVLEEEDGEVCVKCEATCADDTCAAQVVDVFQKASENTEIKLPKTARRGRALATATLTSSEGALTTESTVDEDAVEAPIADPLAIAGASVQSFSVVFISSVALVALGVLAL